MPLGTAVGLGPGHIVLRGDAAPPKKAHSSAPPIFGPYLLRPNGWMDQNSTWYGRRPGPRRLCVRRGPSSPLPKRGQSPTIFGPCLLWPNGGMDQGGTWRGGGLGPGHIVLDGERGPSSPPPTRGQSPQFLAHVYCGQTAGWIKMPLGTKV